MAVGPCVRLMRLPDVSARCGLPDAIDLHEGTRDGKDGAMKLAGLMRVLRGGGETEVEPTEPVDTDTVALLAERLEATSRRRLGRSLSILHIDTGSCNGCEAELRALTGALYDLERYGLTFVESPRHADILLVTGPLTANLRDALEQAWDATPDPKWVVALGDCAIDGGVFKGSYAVLGGVGISVPVDLTIGGCPPSPARILAGLRALLEVNRGPLDGAMPGARGKRALDT